VTGAWPLDADAPDDDSLARLEQQVAALRGALCVDCRRMLCDHESLFNVALGLSTMPRCLSCLAVGLAKSATELRDQLLTHFQHRECYGEVWRRTNEREGFPRLGLPSCLWPDSSGTKVETMLDRQAEVGTSLDQSHGGITVAEDWDAGEMGCGDLVLALRLRMDRLPPRATLKLVARDPGAREDIPAWCRMTAHTLLAQSHPEYWIQRKE
jgi:tRNA 2-thiouridine synthesizing protein A